MSLLFLLVFFTILCLVIFIFLLLIKSSKSEALSFTPFECGFTSFYSSRMSFSIHYFFVTLIFLFLDLELFVMFPMFCLDFLDFGGFLCGFIFLAGALMALFMEWGFGKMEWSS